MEANEHLKLRFPIDAVDFDYRICRGLQSSNKKRGKKMLESSANAIEHAKKTFDVTMEFRGDDCQWTIDKRHWFERMCHPQDLWMCQACMKIEYIDD